MSFLHHFRSAKRGKMSLNARQKWLRELNSEVGFPLKFLTDKTCYCKLCETSFNARQKSELQQHLQSRKHEQNSKLKGKRTASQAQLEEVIHGKLKKQRSRSSILGKQLHEAFLAADIPWIKLEVPKLRNFLEENIGVRIPEQTTLRRVYMEECYLEAMETIKTNLKDSPIWVGTDETTDALGRYVANILIGKLDHAEFHAPYLVDCTFLEKTDSSTIARLVNDTLRMLWPNFDPSLLKIFLTDSAAYMLKAGRNLKVFYPDMLHITCFAHAIHRVCEMVREMFRDVNNVIATVKKVFLKAPSRVLVWKENLPNLPLPPEPVLTRWGTWIQAALFYAQNLESIKGIIERLDPEEAKSIERAQELMQNRQLVSDLAFIQANLYFLPSLLTKLEEAGLTLGRAFELMDQAEEKIKSIGADRGKALQDKFKAVMGRNPDVEKLRAVAGVLGGAEGELPEGIGARDAASLKYCPTASVDVERSFSVYKNVLTDRRQSLMKENLKMIMVTHCFYSREN